MKRVLLCFVLIIALSAMTPIPAGFAAAGADLVAVPTASAVLVDGASVDFDAYNIAFSNYFKLRDIAFVLNGTAKQFEVSWDDANDAISLISGLPYTLAGGEMTAKGAGVKTPLPSTSKIMLDGKEISLTAYEIEWNNYFKLRDLGKAMNFGVDWNEALNTIAIDTNKGYTEEAGADGADTAVTVVEQPAATGGVMTAESSGIINGVIGEKYGKRGSQLSGEGTPTLSLPLSIKNAPAGTVCYAVKMMDPDSEPLCGYAWAHWNAVNITAAELPENASIAMAGDMTQGTNDFGELGYGGPAPPDKPHTYVITIFALDAHVDLADGFAKELFDAAIVEHILAVTQISGSYSDT